MCVLILWWLYWLYFSTSVLKSQYCYHSILQMHGQIYLLDISLFSPREYVS